MDSGPSDLFTWSALAPTDGLDHSSFTFVLTATPEANNTQRTATLHVQKGSTALQYTPFTVKVPAEMSSLYSSVVCNKLLVATSGIVTCTIYPRTATKPTSISTDDVSVTVSDGTLGTISVTVCIG